MQIILGGDNFGDNNVFIHLYSGWSKLSVFHIIITYRLQLKATRVNTDM